MLNRRLESETTTIMLALKDAPVCRGQVGIVGRAGVTTNKTDTAVMVVAIVKQDYIVGKLEV